jgi:hypothetical protein
VCSGHAFWACVLGCRDGADLANALRERGQDLRRRIAAADSAADSFVKAGKMRFTRFSNFFLPRRPTKD